MAENGSQGNSDQGQESGASSQGQGQESAPQNGNQGQASGADKGKGNDAPDFTKMSEAELREFASRSYKDLGLTRAEAAKYRTQHQEAQAKLTEAERAKMTEAEKVQADLTEAQNRAKELESKVEDLTKGSAVRDALATAGAINPATAFKVGSWGNVKLDDDGTVNHDSFKAVVDKLRKSDPYLFKRGASADAGAGREQEAAPQGASGGINALIRGGGR